MDENDQKKTNEFIGHTSRKNGIEKFVLCGTIKGEEVEADEEKYKWIAQTPLQQMTNTELIHLTDNRENWRTLIINTCARSNTCRRIVSHPKLCD